jgi:septal ring factor EnvC (AmiA/AmiB activator)
MYWKQLAGLVAILAIAASIWIHFNNDRDTRISLEAAIAEVYATKEELKATQHALLQATAARKELDDQIKESEDKRAKIQSDLQETLKRMRGAKVPTECKDAISWAVRNKGDLKW